MVSQRPIKQTKPEEEFEGYTGNAGMTLQRWYRQAVVAIWSNETHYRVICGAGTGSSVAELFRMANQIPELSGDEKLRHRIECRRFGVAILSKWRAGHDMLVGSKRVSAANLMLKVLSRIGSRGLVLRFLKKIAPTDPLLTNAGRLARLCGRFGWSACDAGLTALFEQKEPRRLNRNAALLHALCQHPDRDKITLGIGKKSTDMMLQSVLTWSMQIKIDHWEDRQVDAAKLLMHLFKSQCILDDSDRLAKALELIQQLGEKFDPVAVQIPVACALPPFLTKHRPKNMRAVENWLNSLQTLLEQRTAEEPQPPANFAREPLILCSCANCKSINTFLTAPDAKEFAFRARQDLRGHVEQNIRRYKADLSTVTIRKGSPQTLLCTKTSESWKIRHATWFADCQSLGIIRDFISLVRESHDAKTSNEKKKSGAAKTSTKLSRKR